MAARQSRHAKRQHIGWDVRAKKMLSEAYHVPLQQVRSCRVILCVVTAGSTVECRSWFAVPRITACRTCTCPLRTGRTGGTKDCWKASLHVQGRLRDPWPAKEHNSCWVPPVLGWVTTSLKVRSKNVVQAEATACVAPAHAKSDTQNLASAPSAATSPHAAHQPSKDLPLNRVVSR